ncbi:MAG: trimeric intracellular cation channel family protein [Gammaproteobacteria bacterium]
MTPEVIGFAAVAVCAVTGVLEAGRKPMDLFGVVVIALVAALGGGTLRDLLLDRRVFWVADHRLLVAALGAGLLTFFVARLVRVPPRLFLVPDALGLALFTILGTRIALELDSHWLVASLMGVITGVFGGILRDVLCNEVPLVFGGELYATAAWSGALLLVALRAQGVEGPWLQGLPMATVFLLRMAGIHWRIHLPSFAMR